MTLAARGPPRRGRGAGRRGRTQRTLRARPPAEKRVEKQRAVCPPGVGEVLPGLVRLPPGEGKVVPPDS